MRYRPAPIEQAGCRQYERTATDAAHPPRLPGADAIHLTSGSFTVHVSAKRPPATTSVSCLRGDSASEQVLKEIPDMHSTKPPFSDK